MSLGLSHSLSRHKLKFSPDKVDTMVVQAIALLDDLDKELNIYAMRVKEWYGWHFPEMAKIINDNIAYARVILQMGMKTSASTADLAEILPEEIEAAVKSAAEISMGTEITEEDLDNIQNLARQVVDFTEYRQQLSSYLSARMAAIAPNLTQLVGELVGARLIAHAGSLMNLAKSPASTIQILGAEKALFRALKTKHDTPKYGLIFHASLVGQATGRNKAKIARVLAAKAAIGSRVDALEEWGIEGEDPEHEPSEERKAELGREARHKIERQLAKLEGKPIRAKGVAIGPNGVSTQPGKWEVKEARKYNKDADGLVGDEPAAAAPPPTKKIEDITPAVEPAISKDVEMTNGNHDEDVDESMEDADSESEKEDEDEDDFDPYKLSSTLSKTKIEPSSSKPTIRPSNGLKESESESSESEAEEIVEETPEEKRRREKKERKRLRKEDEAKPETKEARAIAKECGLSLKRYREKLERGKIELGEDGKPTAQAKKDMRRHKKEMNNMRKERKAEERARKKAERKQKKLEQSTKAPEKTPEERAAKKARKAEAKAAKLAKKAEKSSSKKRKRAEDGDAVAEKAEKKRKKREKAEAELT